MESDSDEEEFQFREKMRKAQCPNGLKMQADGKVEGHDGKMYESHTA